MSPVPKAPTEGPDRRPQAEASILIVGYRAYDELQRCLASIDRHEPDAEVIVVDHDADEARGRAIAAAHGRVRYVARRQNPGFGAGVNLAARHATRPFLLLLNPDCELREPVTAPLAACLNRHPEAAIAGGLIREPDGRVQPSARAFPDWTTAFGGRTSWLTRVAPENPLTRWNLDSGAPDGGARRVEWVTGAFLLIRRQVFESLGGFDEGFFMYWEDADLCRRALADGWHTMHDPAVEIVHHTGRASRHAPVRSLAAFHRSVFRFYWKHAGPLGRGLSPLVVAGLCGRFLLRLPRAVAARD